MLGRTPIADLAAAADWATERVETPTKLLAVRAASRGSQLSTPRKNSQNSLQSSSRFANVISHSMDVNIEDPVAEGVPPHATPSWDVGERPTVRMAIMELPVYNPTPTRRRT